MCTKNKENVVFANEELRQEALKFVKGIYQRDFLLGYYRFCGSDLHGNAGKYPRQYSESLYNLLDRLEKAGIHSEIKKGYHGLIYVEFSKTAPKS